MHYAAATYENLGSGTDHVACIAGLDASVDLDGDVRQTTTVVFRSA